MIALLIMVVLYEYTHQQVFLDLLAVAVLIELIIRFAIATKEDMNNGSHKI